MRGGSAPRSKPLLFDTSFLAERVSLSYVYLLLTINIITLMIIENRALLLARSFALSRYNHRAVIITLKAGSFQNGRQIC